MHDVVGVKYHEAQSVCNTTLQRRQRKREHDATEASFLVVRENFCLQLSRHTCCNFNSSYKLWPQQTQITVKVSNVGHTH